MKIKIKIGGPKLEEKKIGVKFNFFFISFFFKIFGRTLVLGGPNPPNLLSGSTNDYK
jgi:hypothetical protein